MVISCAANKCDLNRCRNDLYFSLLPSAVYLIRDHRGGLVRGVCCLFVVQLPSVTAQIFSAKPFELWILLDRLRGKSRQSVAWVAHSGSSNTVPRLPTDQV